MKIKLQFYSLGALALLLALGSCGEDKFKIKGEITGSDGQAIYLEKSDFNGRWVTLDSVKLKKNGSFSISFPSPASPDIYRLALNNGYIYVPIDSTETVTVTSSYADFGKDFTLAGSRNAEQMEKFEKDLMALPQNASETSKDEFKKKVYSTYIQANPASILGYYILTKYVGENPLFDPNNAQDAKYFGAVATGFKTLKPNDPHTALLEQTTLNALKKKNSEAGLYREITANELTIIDMDLPDVNGNNVKLSDIAGKGKPVAVIFSVLNHQDSPALNYELSQIYNRHKPNVDFYQVSFDADQFGWVEAAKNIPWTNVYSPGGFNSEAAQKYNVGQVPTFFVYDRQGNLILGTYDLKELESALK